MVKGFDARTVTIDGSDVHFAMGGDGPPVVLLHGFPQTHAMWHAVAPILAEKFTVIAPDLRGYGQSAKPAGTRAYGFDNMAKDICALLDHLGVLSAHIVGHDRGGRVAHRLALDAPARVRSLTVMDIVPTHYLLENLNKSVASAYYHWFFLAQPEPFAQEMIGHDPDAYFESCLIGWGGATLRDFAPQAIAAYRNAWHDPETVRGMCADYRATLAYDFDLDATNLRDQIGCPALVLYGADGKMAQAFDVPDTWRERLKNMSSAPVTGGHFFVDQHPMETAEKLLWFLSIH